MRVRSHRRHPQRRFLHEAGTAPPDDLEQGLERSLQGLAGLALLRA
ncbi:MAG: hypothetical protein ACRDZS_06850 [Acidimicrobiales bacterium]